MISVAIKKLKNNLSKYLYQVKKGEDILITERGKIIDSFKRDWNSLIRVEATDELNDWIDKMVSRCPLRGFDAIHLASALIVHDKLPEEFLFACFDNQLLQAAQTAGLQTLPEPVD